VSGAAIPNGPGHKSPSTTAGSQIAKVSLTKCTQSQLSLSLGQSLAGAGNRSFVVLFRNTSSSACRLQGYPSVAGVGASGRRIGLSRHALAASALRSVTLHPDQKGSSLLQTVGVQRNGDTCVEYRSVLVRAPNTRRFFRVPLKWKPGQGPATHGLAVCGTVFVGPVSAVSPSASPTRTPSATPMTSPVTPTTTPTTSPPVAASIRCQPSDLRLAVGQPVSEKTEQHSVLLTVTNVGSVACSLFGYPGISLYDAQGRLLNLSYEWRGDQMVTTSPPREVDLAVGGKGFGLINKNVCVGPQVAIAATLRVIPPDATVALVLGNPPGGLTSCESGDVGNALAISPIEPTESAAFAQATPP
jgi:Protein of unknown function (DUF4232)